MTWEETALSSENKRLKKENTLLNNRYSWCVKRLHEKQTIIDDLEEKLKAIKYLDRQEVEDIIVESKLLYANGKDYTNEFDRVITAICKLAIPSRDKIIEVLKRNKYNFIYYPKGKAEIDEDIFETLADEILKEGK